LYPPFVPPHRGLIPAFGVHLCSMLKRLKTNPLKNANYKLLLIVLFFLALIAAVFIYYNRRLKGIENNLKQGSSLSYRIKGTHGNYASPRRRSPHSSSPKERTLASLFIRTLSFGEGRVRRRAFKERTNGSFPLSKRHFTMNANF
jgi:hypothetical protein